MSEPRTEARRKLIALHREQTSWPSRRDDPNAGPDGYLHYCDIDHTELRYPCAVLRAAEAIEAEAATTPSTALDEGLLYRAVIEELSILWGEPSDGISAQVRPIFAQQIVDRYARLQSTESRTATRETE